ncbi:hypothetical protein QTO34_006048 [Cnephaeus nilssonii]|uniref:THIF-type NAD/FAD binding fold domain-containing protein n=1 Tax=Cnephaeus nilssonii TaxID=3371016 RepID=A0AA40HLX8_CNENI|nr:hypothetical protein QTO34_006048 [Eptesicus nilssonii]
MALTLSSSRRWRCELSVPPAQLATLRLLANRGHSEDVECDSTLASVAGMEKKGSKCKRLKLVLVVGAGGIVCELLKSLVLTGFSHIELIDLDTIDKHVGRSKAQVAKESVLQFHPKANIIAYHDSIMNPDYTVEFFRQFILVMNALDNRAARNHVNRMCLAAEVPLIESGTAGYLGQVTTIKKGVTECYECHPKPTQRTFPGCTIRNTPSEPIRCIVWAKYLFNQLFGEEDADQEVSADRAAPEASWEPMEAEARVRASNEDDDIKRVSTKEGTKSVKRKPLVPLDWAAVQSQGEEINAADQQNEPQSGLKDQQVLDVKSYARLFSKSIETLRVHLAEKGDGAELIWDKDDPSAILCHLCCKPQDAYFQDEYEEQI